MSRSMRIGLGILVALLLAGSIFFLRTRLIAVEIARVEENIPVDVFGLGTVEARLLSRIGFEVSNTLVELHSDHGDRVVAGSVLAKLHAAEQEARVARAEAAVANARAAVGRAEAVVGKARAVLKQRQETNARRQGLRERGTISVEAAQEAQLEADVAAAELAVAIRDEAVAQAALADATAQLAYEKVVLEHHTLRAPYDALVVERHREVGSVLAPGETLFTLVDPQSVWVLAYIDESRTGALAVGQSAQIRLRSLPHRVFEGRVARIGIESDRVNEERRVYVTCSDCPEQFHLGEQAEVLIRVATLGHALLVPETAAENIAYGKAVVWTVENGRLARRQVAIGHRTLDGRFEILGPLPKGVSIVASRASALAEGKAVRILERGE